MWKPSLGCGPAAFRGILAAAVECVTRLPDDELVINVFASRAQGGGWDVRLYARRPEDEDDCGARALEAENLYRLLWALFEDTRSRVSDGAGEVLDPRPAALKLDADADLGVAEVRALIAACAVVRAVDARSWLGM